MGIVVIVLLCIIAGVAYLRFRDPLYPPFVHAAWWATILAGYEFFRPTIIDLPAAAYLIVGVGAFTFSTGSYLATYGWEARPRTNEGNEIPNPVVAEVIFWVTLAGLLVFITTARNLAAMGPFDNFLVNVRWVTGGNSFADEDPLQSFGPVAYMVSVSVVSMALQFFLREYHGSSWRYIVSIMAALVYAVLSTGRTFILIVAMVIFGLYLITGRMSAKRGITLLAIVGIAMFAGMGIVLGKGGGSGVEIVLGQFRIYLLGGLAAFGQHIGDPVDLAWGANTFRTPLLVLAKLGLDVPVPELMKEYRFIPDPTNVYTFYRPYFDDFGYAGAFVAPFFFGALHGKVYVLARNGSKAWMIMFSLLLFPLFMQFFQDQYLSLLSTWVQYSAWVTLAFLAARTMRAGGAVPVRTEVPGT